MWFHMPLMNPHASAGRMTCGVVRIVTPVWPAMFDPWLANALAELSGSISR